VQSWLTEIGQKEYASRKAGLKKEFPAIVWGCWELKRKFRLSV
jgi:hypothetical protein